MGAERRIGGVVRYGVEKVNDVDGMSKSGVVGKLGFRFWDNGIERAIGN